ncbi:hypothetical protein [Polynucleobacter asymbioticus]|uniref:Uncharacterized protein n=1 Tax=Polynucleobacter asymbioticus TaxID=576611 RepID=A0AAC9NFH8_9BURK|nr:hypothetical protein [Polynucleobacter asymbioticus]APB98144.1 hypothetical protein A4F89_01740 [Polynucleobacter asymbioticus]APC00430.1 hypothetical protein AOC25_01745 [Polynucleobacter asymbioticus]
MASLKSQQLVQAIYENALAKSTALRPITLTHEVEHAGYGAMLSRLMTGLNQSFIHQSNYHFEARSPYQIEKLFDIAVKQNQDGFSKNKKKVWHFFRDTWDVKYPLFSWRWFTKKPDYKERTRAQHQFPQCPIASETSLTRHQWCAILAQLICGKPTPYLRAILEQKKSVMGWDPAALHIGIHVRRGDKNTECPYIPTPTYVQFFHALATQYPDRAIQLFLTSDDPDSYADFKAALPNIPILWDQEEPRFNNCNVHMVGDQPDLALQESITAAKNICLLGECDYVIGMASAQFTWIGGLLCIFNNHLDTSRQIMIDPITQKQSHWACTYGFSLDELLA